MTQNNTDLKLDALDIRIRDTMDTFARAVSAILGGNLKSITVVGSSLSEDFRPGHSDINTVLVLDRQAVDSLNAVAAMARPMRRKKLSPPLLMTSSYIERSRDVFGVEFLDFQLTHHTILGDDPFAALRFEKKNVRLQCERELKAILIRLRQGYIASAANRRLVRDILISTAKNLAPLLRAMLWLKDIERPFRTEPTFDKTSDIFSVNVDPLKTSVKWRHERIRLSAVEMENAFASVYSTVERLADIVDTFEV